MTTEARRSESAQRETELPNNHIRLPFGIFEQPAKILKNPDLLGRAIHAAIVVKEREFMDMGMSEESLTLVVRALREGSEVMRKRFNSSDKAEKRRGKRELTLFFQNASDTYRRQENQGGHKPNEQVVFTSPESK